MTDLDSLISVAEDEKQSSYKRRQALSDLMMHHPEDERSYTAFKNATQTNDAFLIREMVSSVKDVKAPKLLPILRDLLKVGDDYTKRDVIQVLGKNGTEEDLKILENYCSDKSYSVSYAAKQAMASLEKSLSEISVAEEPIKAGEAGAEKVEAVTEEFESQQEITVLEEPELSLDTEAETVPLSKEAKDESMEELLSEKRDSLHDNSIFKDNDIADVHKKLESKSTVFVSAAAPALSGYEVGSESLKLKTFFAGHYQTAQTLYKQLKETQKQLPVKEQKLSDVRRQLMLLEADKADDLELSSESTEEQSKKSEDIKWQIKKVQLDLSSLTKENQGFWQNIVNSFSEGRQQELEEKKQKLNKKLKSLKKELLESEQHLLDEQTVTTQLSQPLLTLRQECEACETERQKCQQKLYELEKQIASLYQERLNELEDFSFLENQSQLVIATVEKLKKLYFEIAKLEEALSQCEEDLVLAEKRAVSSTDDISRSLSSSLTVSKKSAKTSVDISTVVNFKEESSFFSGYSNASGSARGEGQATLRYEISEMNWQPANNLSKSIRDFRTHYERLGENSSKLSSLKREYYRLLEFQRQYVDYVRVVIEKNDNE